MACHWPKRRAPSQTTKFVDILGEPRDPIRRLAGALTNFTAQGPAHPAPKQRNWQYWRKCSSSLRLMAGQVGTKNVERRVKLSNCWKKTWQRSMTWANKIGSGGEMPSAAMQLPTGVAHGCPLHITPLARKWGRAGTPWFSKRRSLEWLWSPMGPPRGSTHDGTD